MIIFSFTDFNFLYGVYTKVDKVTSVLWTQTTETM